MPIKNYTTTVAPEKTIAAIQKMLARHGAQQVIIQYSAEGHPIGLSFVIRTAGTPQLYRLPVSIQGVRNTLERDKAQKKFQNDAQALRIAWRVVHDWIAAQLAMLDIEQASLLQMFLAYLVTPSNETVYECMARQGKLLQE